MFARDIGHCWAGASPIGLVYAWIGPLGFSSVLVNLGLSANATLKIWIHVRIANWGVHTWSLKRQSFTTFYISPSLHLMKIHKIYQYLKVICSYIYYYEILPLTLQVWDTLSKDQVQKVECIWKDEPCSSNQRAKIMGTD